MASSKVSPAIRDFLNNIVGKKIDDYTIELEESPLKGDNFSGEIIFLSLKSKKDGIRTHYIIKQSQELPPGMDFMKDIYTNEIRFYEKIWPILDEFQKARSVGFDQIPKFFGSYDVDGDQKIALEDLRQKQFRMYDKTQPLDEQHFRLIFESYATFHAISFAFRERHPEEFLELTNGLTPLIDPEKDQAKMEAFKNIIEMRLKLAYDVLDDGGAKEAVGKYLGKGMEIFGKAMMYMGNQPILVHGDCWSNNFLFKYNDKNEVSEMRFLDFQQIKSGSPVHDLSYCIYSGASKEILDKLDDYLKLYHRKFVETLEKLECRPETPYTLDILKSDWKTYCQFGFLAGLMLWGLKLMHSDHAPKIKEAASMNEAPPLAEGKEELQNTIIRGLVHHLYENDFL